MLLLRQSVFEPAGTAGGLRKRDHKKLGRFDDVDGALAVVLA